MLDYQEFFDQAPSWREELEKQLAPDHGEISITYAEVANAFPSSLPHSKTLAHPSIDDTGLAEWAKQRGWKVALETDPQQNELPRVIFTKLK